MKDLRNTIVHEYVEENLKELFEEVMEYISMHFKPLIDIISKFNIMYCLITHSVLKIYAGTHLE